MLGALLSGGCGDAPNDPGHMGNPNGPPWPSKDAGKGVRIDAGTSDDDASTGRDGSSQMPRGDGGGTGGHDGSNGHPDAGGPTGYTRRPCKELPASSGDGPQGSLRLTVDVVADGLEARSDEIAESFHR